MLAWLAGLSPVSRFAVEGESMTPTYVPGERLLINRLAYVARAPRPGDVVVLRDPTQAGRLLLKRVVRAVEGGWLVQGDNREASRDSRHFGAVPRSCIVGRVWCRY